jgi:hypothetical protein
VLGRRCTQWRLGAALALAVALPVASAGAATRTADVPTTLLGVWHKNMTQAQWKRVGALRESGVYTAVIKKTGAVIIYLPGAYRSGCSSCADDFETTIATAGAQLTLGRVPVCSFKGTYSWLVSGRTLTLKPTADKRCPIRETFFGGRWTR